MLDMIARDNGLNCEPGVIRLFGAADIGGRGLLGGWSDPEEGHSWNDGPDASLLVTLPGPPARQGLTVVGEPYVTRKKVFQEITLFGNGARIKSWRMTARVETPLYATLEPEWWFVRDRLAMMTLTFHLPHCARPKDINDGTDGRELGFCFHSICLRPIGS